MAMTFTAIKEDICTEEGTFAMNFVASGTILGGEGLVVCGETTGTGRAKVKVCGTDQEFMQAASGSGFIGVAAYAATDGKAVGVYMPGNKVTVRASGAITAGNQVVATTKGFFKTSIGKGSSNAQGVALEDFTSNEAGIIWLY